jgi:cobalt/nickel transport system permease protein
MLGEGRNSILVAGAVGGWLSMMVGAVATGVELGISGTSPIGVAVPAMAIVHALLGIIEAVITTAVLTFLYSTRRDLLEIGENAPAQATATWVTIGLVIAVAVAALSPFASPNPDGLETVAHQNGFLEQAMAPLYDIMPDYTIPFISNATFSGIVAIVVGVLIVFGVAFFLGRSQRKTT